MYLQTSTRPDLVARSQRLGEAQSRPSPTIGQRIEQWTSRPASESEPSPKQQAAATPGFDPDIVRAVQRELDQRGYAPGPSDGMVHPVTRAAIMAYEFDHGMPLTGQPSEDLLKGILFGITATRAQGASARQISPEAAEIVRSVQQSLSKLGFAIGTIDGRIGEETARAIRRFEAQQGLPQTGRISGAMFTKLTEATARQQRKAMAY